MKSKLFTLNTLAVAAESFDDFLRTLERNGVETKDVIEGLKVVFKEERTAARQRFLGRVV